METTFTILLLIHIVSGSIGLITGTINLIRKKGDKLHKNFGFFFLSNADKWGFRFINVTNSFQFFLLIVGVFSIYMVSTGQRYLSLKTISPSQKALKIDWILSAGMFLFGIGFIIYGILLLLSSNNFGIVLLVFGFISISMAYQDFKNYQGRNSNKNFWLLVHIQRMMGSYIAAMTAFIVVNNTILPGIVAWLLPTVIVTPLIFKWSRKYKIQTK